MPIPPNLYSLNISGKKKRSIHLTLKEILRKSVCHRVRKFRTEVYLRIIDRLIHQSINKNVPPSRSLLRSALEPGQAEKNSLQKLVKLSTGQWRNEGAEEGGRPGRSPRRGRKKPKFGVNIA